MTRRPRPARLRGDDGAVLVEAALVLPIILFLMLGMTEYSVAELQANQASSAARDGARVGILDYRQADVDGSAANTAVKSAVYARVVGKNPADITVTVSCLKSDGSTVVCANAVAQQDRIQVAVSWPYRKLTGIVPITPSTISSTSRMALVGQVMSTSTTVSSSSSSTPSSSTPSSSTPSSSTPSSSTPTTVTPPGCTISNLVVNNGTTGQLPTVNNGGKLSDSLQIFFGASGSTCGNFVVTVWPTGGGTTSGTGYSAPNGVSYNAGTGKYTAIYNKTDNGISWVPGDVLVQLSSNNGTIGGTTSQVVNLPSKN